MNIQPHHVRHTLKIALLAGITIIVAIGITFLFPRFSIAPVIDPVPVPANPSDQNHVVPVVQFETLQSSDRISVNQQITGKAPGRWFFEASFPIELRDINGTVFANTYGSTDEDWMTTEYVSFTFTLPASFSYTGVGDLRLQKDDPSDGEAPFDPATDEFIIPVIFE